jgi:hypothetical protein
MTRFVIHKATELKPEFRAALEAELGRTLPDEEYVSISTFDPHPAPTGDAKRQAADRLLASGDKIEARMAPGAAEEIEKEIKEALRSVRPNYREIE